MFATTVANPGETQRAASNMPQKPKLVAPNPIAPIWTHARTDVGQGRFRADAITRRVRPARRALNVANRSGGTDAWPSSINGKHNAHKKNTRSNLNTFIVARPAISSG